MSATTATTATTTTTTEVATNNFFLAFYTVSEFYVNYLNQETKENKTLLQIVFEKNKISQNNATTIDSLIKPLEEKFDKIEKKLNLTKEEIAYLHQILDNTQ